MLINEKIKQFFGRSSNYEKRVSRNINQEQLTIRNQIPDKISESDDLLIHVTKTFGQNFMDKLLNNELSEDYLKAVEVVLNNFETQNEGNKYDYNTIQEENEEIDSPQLKQKKATVSNLKRNLSETKIKKFQTSKSAERLLKTYNKTLGIGRKFMNYTTSSSDYFDKGIATGGISKLEYNENIRKRNLKQFK